MSNFSSLPAFSLHSRPGLISLAEARSRPEIVYHSVAHICVPKATPAPSELFVGAQVKLQRRKEIKYRREARKRIHALRAERNA